MISIQRDVKTGTLCTADGVQTGTAITTPTPPTSDANHQQETGPHVTHNFCPIWLAIRGSHDLPSQMYRSQNSGTHVY